GHLVYLNSLIKNIFCLDLGVFRKSGLFYFYVFLDIFSNFWKCTAKRHPKLEKRIDHVPKTSLFA
ncbi:TPA: hypothetical protein ACGAEV_003128, partial [Legionella pneumophila]